jgi:peptidyl-prolyl cis-trans isomerase A (cyclophilin A)
MTRALIIGLAVVFSMSATACDKNKAAVKPPTKTDKAEKGPADKAPEAAADKKKDAPKAPDQKANKAKTTSPAGADPAAASKGVSAGQKAYSGKLQLGTNDPSFLEGIAGSGPLFTTIVTSMGTLNCRLYEKKTPNAVLNFVGLARGLKPWRDPKTKAVVTSNFYEGITFHRVIPKFMVQVGDPTGTGAFNPGFGFGNEIDPGLKHDRGGLLSMANTGRPNSNGSQFFVTEVATSWLDGKHPIFGDCGKEGSDLVKKMAAVPTGPKNKPLEAITISKVTFRRGK